jgi:hypothetical protein
MSRIGDFSIGFITAVGIKIAGGAVPALKPVMPVVSAGTFAISMLTKLDTAMEDDASASVLAANTPKGGNPPFLLMLPFTATRSKPDLEAFVNKNGGTAWFQGGANNRLEAYWTLSHSFVPRQTKECPLGAVAHGTRNGVASGVFKTAR